MPIHETQGPLRPRNTGQAQVADGSGYLARERASRTHVHSGSRRALISSTPLTHWAPCHDGGVDQRACVLLLLSRRRIGESRCAAQDDSAPMRGHDHATTVMGTLVDTRERLIGFGLVYSAWGASAGTCKSRRPDATTTARNLRHLGGKAKGASVIRTTDPVPGERNGSRVACVHCRSLRVGV